MVLGHSQVCKPPPQRSRRPQREQEILPKRVFTLPLKNEQVYGENWGKGSRLTGDLCTGLPFPTKSRLGWCRSVLRGMLGGPSRADSLDSIRYKMRSYPMIYRAFKNGQNDSF